jgi:beta-glucosidase
MLSDRMQGLSVTASRYHMGSPIEVAATTKPVILLPVRQRGLSISFSFRDLKVSSLKVDVGRDESASVVVTKTGPRTADEVVQLYLHQKYGSGSRPSRELKGFKRLTLTPGESKTVTFRITSQERQYWSSASKGCVAEPSEFDVWIGDSSVASLHGSFTVGN